MDEAEAGIKIAWSNINNLIYANRKQKKAGAAMLISDETDLKIRILQEIKKDTI